MDRPPGRAIRAGAIPPRTGCDVSPAGGGTPVDVERPAREGPQGRGTVPPIRPAGLLSGPLGARIPVGAGRRGTRARRGPLMCGIAGIAGTGAGDLTAEGEAMAGALCHRGPDAHAVLSLRDCLLAHTRLAILDLTTGDQPMKDRAVPIAITFNGEIYNFLELRHELEHRGHVFATRSDTEVILKSYLEYGTGCAEHLDGQFAFGLWDARSSTLLLARDRFGKKPLYYAFDRAGNLVFGSELKALIASRRVDVEIDPAALDVYLRLLYVPPDRTIYRNVQVVPPASVLVFREGRATIQQYWRLPHRPVSIGYTEARE